MGNEDAKFNPQCGDWRKEQGLRGKSGRGQRAAKSSLLTLAQPNGHLWGAKNSQSLLFPCLFWEVHLTASSSSLLLQFLLIALLCIQQKCSEACVPAPFLPASMSFLFVPKACWPSGWGGGGDDFGSTSFIYKVANLIIVFLSYPRWLQDWPLVTFTKALSLLLGSGVWGIACPHRDMELSSCLYVTATDPYEHSFT